MTTTAIENSFVTRHSEHRLPDEVEEALNRDHAARMAAVRRGHERVAAARLTAEDRRVLRGAESRVRADEAVRHALRDFTARVRPELLGRFVPDLVDVDPAPRAADNMMWWARTQWFPGGGIGIESLSDGLHYFGQRTYDGDNLIGFSVASFATFELPRERRTPAARYRSLPYTEAFGEVTGWANLQVCPWACDDKWCKCRLVLRQSAIQFVPGQGFKLCGENITQTQIIDRDGEGTGETFGLPGFQPMPPLEFALLAPNETLIIDVEVRFDCQLEGSSMITFSPNSTPAGSVVVRYPQWSVTPA